MAFSEFGESVANSVDALRNNSPYLIDTGNTINEALALPTQGGRHEPARQHLESALQILQDMSGQVDAYIETCESSKPEPTVGTLISPLGSRLGAVADSLNVSLAAEQQAQVDPEKERILILSAPAKAVVAEQYRDEVMRPRQQIWDTTTELLRRTSPASITYAIGSSGSRYPKAIIAWELSVLDTEKNVELWTRIEGEVLLGMTGDPQLSELRNAVRLYCDKLLETQQSTKEILGVKAEGGLFQKKRVSKKDLAAAIHQEAIEELKELKFEVFMRPAGTSDKNWATALNGSVTQLSLRGSSYHGMLHKDSTEAYEEVAGSRQHSYLKPEPQDNPTTDDVRQHLYNLLCADGVGPSFRDLQEVNDLIKASQPRKKHG